MQIIVINAVYYVVDWVSPLLATAANDTRDLFSGSFICVQILEILPFCKG
jgi:hypothetical protein